MKIKRTVTGSEPGHTLKFVDVKEFEVGDTVKLKSGGKVMTVIYVESATNGQFADAMWITDDGETVAKVSNIPFACLVEADPPA